MSPVLYDELVKDNDANPGNNNIGWLCCVCKGIKSDLRSINSIMLELKSSNDKRLQQVEDKLSSRKNSIRTLSEKKLKLPKLTLQRLS